MSGNKRGHRTKVLSFRKCQRVVFDSTQGGREVDPKVNVLRRPLTEGEAATKTPTKINLSTAGRHKRACMNRPLHLKDVNKVHGPRNRLLAAEKGESTGVTGTGIGASSQKDPVLLYRNLLQKSLRFDRFKKTDLPSFL